MDSSIQESMAKQNTQGIEIDPTTAERYVLSKKIYAEQNSVYHAIHWVQLNAQNENRCKVWITVAKRKRSE